MLTREEQIKQIQEHACDLISKFMTEVPDSDIGSIDINITSYAKAISQADKACLLAREYKLDAECAHSHYGGYRIGAKRYHSPIDFTVAIISAFKKVGIPIPQEILDRPNDID